MHVRNPKMLAENGSRKSTILKSIACAYIAQNDSKSYYPSIFFLDTPWERIKNVTLEYVYKRGSKENTQKLTKLNTNWSYPENRIRLYLLNKLRNLKKRYCNKSIIS